MDHERLAELVRRLQRDSGGAFIAGLTYIGDRLGLLTALAQGRPQTSEGLAAATGLQERYVREWLAAMAAFGYIEHNADTEDYEMAAEQRAVLADENSPHFGAGTFQFTVRSLLHTDALMAAFRKGGGIGFAKLHPEIPESIDRMHRPWFDHLLTSRWLPAIPGLIGQLQAGIDGLDVGCGLGRSTVAMGRAYPASRFLGIDPHRPSIARAERLAAEQSVPNTSFEALELAELSSDRKFRMVLAIDCVHDMADPVGALRVIRSFLAEDGLFVWSEPTGSTNPLENQDELTRLRAALSSYHCLTVSLAEGGAGLGTLIGESGARNLAERAGFERFEVLPVPSDAQMFFGLSC